ncbi:exported hypothetical protein [Gammaproteobacteria bacterium]
MYISIKANFIMCMLLNLSLFQCVNTYGTKYHEMIGSISDYYLALNNKAVPFNKEIESIESISAWADKVKYLPDYRWTRPYHYIDTNDNPPEYCNATVKWWGNGTDGGNLMKGLNIYSNYTTADHFKLFVHFYQDLHQPLHISGLERGGNGVLVNFMGRSTNLHSTWDSLILDTRSKIYNGVKGYKRYLIRKFNNKHSLTYEKCKDFDTIMKEHNQYNCDYVYKYLPANRVIDKNYIDKVKSKVDYLVYRAGYCLSLFI